MRSEAAFHHVGIQTRDFANAVGWYVDFLSAEVCWELTEFSELTRRRLPGITRLAEVRSGDLRLHLFERGELGTPAPELSQFQHLCLSVGDVAALRAYQDRWYELQRTGKYTFAIDEPPTEIVVDADGVHSFYAPDPDGLELEFTYVPAL
jgi:catechol 2,3-dioxygenase-like lactoylglutathione lyase family enzyme